MSATPKTAREWPGQCKSTIDLNGSVTCACLRMFGHQGEHVYANSFKPDRVRRELNDALWQTELALAAAHAEGRREALEEAAEELKFMSCTCGHRIRALAKESTK